MAYLNCVNCGKQNLVDEYYKPTDECYSCHQPIGVKVGEKPAAAAAPAPATEMPAKSEEASPTRKVKNKGVRKWRKRCKECDFSYVHDDILWCSKEKCPKNCPKRLRPQYRLKLKQRVKQEVKQVPPFAMVEVTTEYTARLKSGGVVTLKYIGPPLFTKKDSPEKGFIRQMMSLFETYGAPV